MKRKTKKLLGQAIVYSILYVSGVIFCYWAFLQGMTYQEEKMTKKCEEELKKYGISDYQIEEAKEQEKKEKVLLITAILNWINVILMLTFIIVRFYNRQE